MYIVYIYITYIVSTTECILLLKSNNDLKIIERKKFHLSNDSYEVCNNLYFIAYYIVAL